MLVTILIGVAAVLVIFIVVAATRPSAYHVERRLEVATPAGRVFAVLDDLHQFAGVLTLFGSPLDKLEPEMQTTLEGPATGVGQSYAWSGKKAGKGKLTIEESVPDQRVGMKLELVKPMASTVSCALTLVGTPTGSSVTWSMAGNHNFIGRAFGLLVNMDNLLGRDIEKGLAQLKAVVEGGRASTYPATSVLSQR